MVHRNCFHRQVRTNIQGNFYIILLYNFIQSEKTKKWQMSWTENWTPSLRSTEESIVNQNNFKGIEYFVYYKLLWNKKNKF